MARPPVHTHGIADQSALTDMLTQHGYTNVANVQQHGKSWHCSATDSTGASVQLVVDGHGGVHLATENDATGSTSGAPKTA